MPKEKQIINKKTEQENFFQKKVSKEMYKEPKSKLHTSLEKPVIKSNHNENKNNLDYNKDIKSSQAGDRNKESLSDINKSKEVKEEKKKPVELLKSRRRSEAVVNGRDLRISTKQAAAICKFIKNKNIDKAISELEEVSKMKRAIPIKGEIPHRKGKGMMSGRYPLKAAAEFIRLLKSLKSNAINHELELEKVKLSGMANTASRPFKRGGRKRFKRSHVMIKLVPRTKMKKDKKKSKEKKEGVKK